MTSEALNNTETLNDALFSTLNALSDKTLDEKSLAREIGRAKAIKDVSHQIISNASLALEAAKFAEAHMRHKMVPGKENPLRKEAVSILPETMPSMLAIGPSPQDETE